MEMMTQSPFPYYHIKIFILPIIILIISMINDRKLNNKIQQIYHFRKWLDLFLFISLLLNYCLKNSLTIILYYKYIFNFKILV
jgi:hypothetical protein